MIRRVILAASSAIALALSVTCSDAADVGSGASPSGGDAKPSTPAPGSLDTKKEIDPHDVLVFNNLIAAGYLPRYMGFDRAIGLNVWFVRRSDKEPAIFYTGTNGQSLLAPGRDNLIGGDYYVVRDGKMVNLTLDYYLVAKTILAADGGASTSQPAPAVATQPSPPTPSTTSTAQPSPPQSQPVAANAAPAAPPSPALTGRMLLTAFEGANWIEIGQKSAPLIYVVVDPMCHFCHDMWAAIQPHVSRGAVRVRLIPVAILDDPNTPNVQPSHVAAIGLLAAKDGPSAWARHFAGEAPAQPATTDEVVRASGRLTANNMLWVNDLYANKIGGVPLILARTKDGKIGYSQGPEPSDIPAFIERIATISTKD